MSFRKTLLTVAISAVALTGCASNVDKWQPGADYRDREDVSAALAQMREEQASQLDGSWVMRDLSGPYLGGAEVQPVDPAQTLPLSLSGQQSFFTASPATLKEVAAQLHMQTGVDVRVVDGSMPDVPTRASFDYEGPLGPLLDAIGNRYDVDWAYNDGVITLAHTQTRVYELAMFPGVLSSELSMASTSEANGGGNVEESSYTNAGGGMSTNVSAGDDPWEPVERAVANIVPDTSSYSINRGALSIVVNGPPSVQQRVEDYVDRFNDVLLRQVALNIEVYSFDVSDTRSAGFNLNAIYESLTDSYGLSISGPPLDSVEGGGFNVSVLESADSRFAGSDALVRALNQWGETSLVTSATGMILNGQEFPVQSVNRQGYLAESSSNQVVNAGVSSELTPGTVTTGFSMKIVPFIRANNSLMLQYGFSLSTLVSLESVSSGESTIQVPSVDDRAFIQRSMMPLNSTLVVAGFQRDFDGVDRSGGIGGFNRNRDQRKQLIFVTITASKA